MKVLGLSAFSGDAAAAVLVNGRLEAAVEEERLNRIKHWAGFPAMASRACLDATGGEPAEHVAVSRDPRAHFWTKVGRVVVRPSYWGQSASRIKNTVDVAGLGARLAKAGLSNGNGTHIHFVEHQRAHLASAFLASPFEEAAVVSIDGFGDFSSVMWGMGRGNHIDVKGGVSFPHSLGIFVDAFAQFLGFPNFGEGTKISELAAYGTPRFATKVRDIVRVDGDQVRLNLDYFVHHIVGVEMSWDDGEPKLPRSYSPRLTDVFGPARDPRSTLRPHHADLAASVQLVLEECYFALLNAVHKRTGAKAICLAGSVALNCVANGMILERTPFRDVFVQPAAHDAGTSIGAALHVWHELLNQPRRFEMRHAYLGSEYGDAEIEGELRHGGIEFTRVSDQELIDRAASDLANGRIVGWFQGRMELGTHALGSRSILADPRRKAMRDALTARVQHREPFRPFGSSVPIEAVGDFFESSYPSPFMVQAYKIRPSQRARIPAVTHEDGTGRLQTVERDVNLRYWSLLNRFGEITGVPVLVNTSFNESEPIVNTPAQAIDCFMRTNMDVLAIGSFVAKKSAAMKSTTGQVVAGEMAS